MNLELVHSLPLESVDSRNRALMKWRGYKQRFMDLKNSYSYQISECKVLRFYNKNKLKSVYNSFLIEIDNSQYNKFKKLIIKGELTQSTYPTPLEMYFLNDEQLTLYTMFYEEYLESIKPLSPTPV